MGDLSEGRRQRGEEPETGAGWTDELTALDAFEVAFRNLLAARSQVLRMSQGWGGSERLGPLSARLLSWLEDCAGDEIVELIGELRAVIDAEPPGASPRQQGGDR